MFVALTEGDKAVFDTYKELMVLAACVVYAAELRKKLEHMSWLSYLNMEIIFFIQKDYNYG